MTIASVPSNPIQGPRPEQAAGPAPAPPEAPPRDAYEPGREGLPAFPSHFLSDYPMVADRPVELPEEPAPRLQRPVLFVAGYMGQPEQWGPMEEWLGREGVNRFGGIIEGSRPGDLDPGARVFAVRFSEPWHSVEKNAAELKATVEAICRATGATGVDVVCHSKGGLDTRLYLADPAEKIDHVVTLGTPNRGTYLANMELLFRDRFGYPIHPPISDPEVGQTLRELVVDRVDRNGNPTNPTLHRLNQGWDQQRQKAEFLAITGNGIPTITEHPGVTLLGDGVVTRTSGVMPGIPTKHLWFRTHGGLTGSKSVMRELAAFLTDRPLSPGVDLFDSEEDRRKAEEMGLLHRPVEEGYLVAG